MSSHSESSRAWRKSLLILLVIAAAAVAAQAIKSLLHIATKTSPISEYPLPEIGDPFTTTNVVRIQIEIPEEQFETLREFRWEPRTRPARPEVSALVREGNLVYSNVALRLKGTLGSFRTLDDRPGLTLTFNKNVPGQKFHGLTKISLNNSVQDPTFIHEKLCRELMNQIGVPTPQSDFAFVRLNGRELGLYVLLEGATKQFLKKHFNDPGGTLYDGGFVHDINWRLDVTSGDKKTDRSDLRRLVAAARVSDPALRFAEMEKLMDMDRFIKMVAMEALIGHWDSYAQNRNNYRIYHDPESDRLVFIPHGMDQLLAEDRIHNSIFPRMSGLVGRALLRTEEGRKRYLARLREYHAEFFQADALLERVNEIDRRVRAVLEHPPSGKASNSLRRHDQLMEEQRELVRFRCSLIEQELASTF